MSILNNDLTINHIKANNIATEYLTVTNAIILPPALQGTHPVALHKVSGNTFVTTIPYTQNPANAGSTSELPIAYSKEDKMISLYVPWFAAQNLDSGGNNRSIQLSPPLPAELRPTVNTWSTIIAGKLANGAGEGLDANPKDATGGVSIVFSIDTAGVIRIARINVAVNPPTLNGNLDLASNGDYGFGPVSLSYYQY